MKEVLTDGNIITDDGDVIPGPGDDFTREAFYPPDHQRSLKDETVVDTEEPIGAWDGLGGRLTDLGYDSAVQLARLGLTGPAVRNALRERKPVITSIDRRGNEHPVDPVDDPDGAHQGYVDAREKLAADRAARNAK